MLKTTKAVILFMIMIHVCNCEPKHAKSYDEYKKADAKRKKWRKCGVVFAVSGALCLIGGWILYIWSLTNFDFTMVCFGLVLVHVGLGLGITSIVIGCPCCAQCCCGCAYPPKLLPPITTTDQEQVAQADPEPIKQSEIKKPIEQSEIKKPIEQSENDPEKAIQSPPKPIKQDETPKTNKDNTTTYLIIIGSIVVVIGFGITCYCVKNNQEVPPTVVSNPENKDIFVVNVQPKENTTMQTYQK